MNPNPEKKIVLLYLQGKETTHRKGARGGRVLGRGNLVNENAIDETSCAGGRKKSAVQTGGMEIAEGGGKEKRRRLTLRRILSLFGGRGRKNLAFVRGGSMTPLSNVEKEKRKKDRLLSILRKKKNRPERGGGKEHHKTKKGKREVATDSRGGSFTDFSTRCLKKGRIGLHPDDFLRGKEGSKGYWF